MPLSSVELHRSLFFHGGDTGSTPVRDAKIPENFQDLIEYEAGNAFGNGLFWTSQGLVTLKKHVTASITASVSRPFVVAVRFE